MTTSSQPLDHEARDLILTGLDQTLFVEAGAGAGKTTSLVGRILNLVESGIEIDSIAAITFTEAAAIDTRHRLYNALSATTSDRCKKALDRFDHAPIGTLHSFANRILNEFPIAAGLPPGFTVHTQMSSDQAFILQWDSFLKRLLSEAHPPDGPIGGGALLFELCNFDKFTLTSLRDVAEAFNGNWDLVEERVEALPPPVLDLDLTDVFRVAAAVTNSDPPDGDKQASSVQRVRELIAELSSPQSLSRKLTTLDELRTRCNSAAGKHGNQLNWKANGGKAALHELRDSHRALAERATAVTEVAAEYRKHLIGAILRHWVLGLADSRVSDGVVGFHDLLVLARRLITKDANARSALHQRYTHLLLDEFQDTDPIQLAIAVRLTSDPCSPHHSGNWLELKPLPGRLFIVGDPKQSVYRFRRADIAQYLRAAEQVGATTANLTANFRSSAQVIDWVNSVFGELIKLVPDSQPAFHALDVSRENHRDNGSVHLLGVEPHSLAGVKGDADKLRELEAAETAAAIATAVSEQWLVVDEHTRQLRPCRLGDITVLFPARTALPALEAALRIANIAYRSESGDNIYRRAEVRTIMLALHAAADASDQLALIAALRTPLYGISDVELYEWKQLGGGWSIDKQIDEQLAGHPVARTMAHVKSIADRAVFTSPADLVTALVDERRMLDFSLDEPGARDAWRTVRRVVDQAMAWSAGGGHGLRSYLSWVASAATSKGSGSDRPPETDRDAVRLMTIHAAKGLEFPITIVSGLTSGTPTRTSSAVLWPHETWGIVGDFDATYLAYKTFDAQLEDDEGRRLLYIACTRAVDHLVVSLHRKSHNLKPDGTRTKAEQLHEAFAIAAPGAGQLQFSAERLDVPSQVAIDLEWSEFEQWQHAHQVAFTAAKRRLSISAIALAASIANPSGDDPDAEVGLGKEPVDLDLPQWKESRYGMAIGRAVHAVLQFADLSTGSDIPALSKSQCAAEAIVDMESIVTKLAKSAVGAPIVRLTKDHEHHRELFVACPTRDGVVEGRIDLFVRTQAGWVIVDYKTDKWSDPELRVQGIAKYRRQLAAYGVALEHVLREPIVGGVLVRCKSDGPAEQIELTDWVDAMNELRAAMAT